MCVCVCVCMCGQMPHAKSLQSCSTLCNPMDYSPSGSTVCGDFPRRNNGVGSHALLQGIFHTQVSNPFLVCLLNWQVGSLPLMLLGSRGLIYIYIYICPVLDKNKYWTKTTANEWSMPEACRKKMQESMNQHHPDTGWFGIKCIFPLCSQGQNKQRHLT